MLQHTFQRGCLATAKVKTLRVDPTEAFGEVTSYCAL